MRLTAIAATSTGFRSIAAASRDGLGISLQGDVAGLRGGEYLAYGATARVDLPF